MIKRKWINMFIMIGLSVLLAFGFVSGNFPWRVPTNPLTRISLPEVETHMVIDVTQDEAKFLGGLLGLGGCDTATAGFQHLNADTCVWNLTEEGTGEMNWDGMSPFWDPFFSQPDSLSMLAYGLIPDTHYYVRAWAENEVGKSYGDWVLFTTLPATDVDVEEISISLEKPEDEGEWVPLSPDWDPDIWFE